MRSLLQFIARYSNFLVFLLLEVVAFMLIMFGNDYPRSATFSSANHICAWHYRNVTNTMEYFRLRRINTELSLENAELRTQLSKLENRQQDSLAQIVCTAQQERFAYMPARVIHLTTNEQHNYITLDKGDLDSVRVGMGVRNQDGVVGIICAVSNHFSLVIPVIHTKMQVSCRIQRNNYMGTIRWDGCNSHYVSLEEIASHIHPEKGDTIVTSGLSNAFPAEIPIGIVDKTELKEGDVYHTIRVKLIPSFQQLDYVQIIKNRLSDEQKQLEHGMD